MAEVTTILEAVESAAVAGPTTLPATLDVVGIQVRHEIAAGDEAMGEGLSHYWNAGRLLSEIKPQVPHGQWESYLESQAINPRSARQYMQLHRSHTLEAVRQLPSLRQALVRLDEPVTPAVLEPAGWTCTKCTRQADEAHRYCAHCGQARPETVILPDPAPISRNLDEPEPRTDRLAAGDGVWVNLDGTARFIGVSLAAGDMRTVGQHLAEYRRMLADDQWALLLEACELDAQQAQRLIDDITPPEPMEEPSDYDLPGSEIYDRAPDPQPLVPRPERSMPSITQDVRRGIKRGRDQLEALDSFINRLQGLSGQANLQPRAADERLATEVAAQLRSTAAEACDVANDLIDTADRAKQLAAREFAGPEHEPNLGQRIESLRLSMPRRVTPEFLAQLESVVQDAHAELAKICRKSDTGSIAWAQTAEQAAQNTVWAIRTQAHRPIFDPKVARRAGQHYWTASRLLEIAKKCGPDCVLHEPYADPDGRRLQPWPAAESERYED